MPRQARRRPRRPRRPSSSGTVAPRARGHARRTARRPRRLAVTARTDTGRENQYARPRRVCVRCAVNNVNLSGGGVNVALRRPRHTAISKFDLPSLPPSSPSPPSPPPQPIPFVPSPRTSRFVERGVPSHERHDGDGDDADVGNEGPLSPLSLSCPKIIAGLVIYSVRASLAVVHVTPRERRGKKKHRAEKREGENKIKITEKKNKENGRQYTDRDERESE